VFRQYLEGQEADQSGVKERAVKQLRKVKNQSYERELEAAALFSSPRVGATLDAESSNSADDEDSSSTVSSHPMAGTRVRGICFSPWSIYPTGASQDICPNPYQSRKCSSSLVRYWRRCCGCIALASRTEISNLL
jgi:hypothetical protein